VRHILIKTKKKHTNSRINSKETKIGRNRRRRRKGIKKGKNEKKKGTKRTHKLD
jgi:hypothetical protein